MTTPHSPLTIAARTPLLEAVLIASLIGGGLLGGGLLDRPSLAADAIASAESIDSASRERIAADLEYLSSDDLKGRDTGSEGIEKAADHIAERFRDLGLETHLFDGTPFQRFVAFRETVPGPAAQNQLTLRRGEGDPEILKFDQAMRPLALGGSGRVTAPLIFAGYGITAPKAGYDDYAGIDASGKIVVVLRGEPRGGRDDNPFGGPEPTRFAYFATKVQNAIDHGAAGLLIVNRSDAVEQAAKLAQQQLDRQLERLAEVDEALEGLPQAAENARATLEQSRKLVMDQLEALRREVEAAPEGLLGITQAGPNAGATELPVASLGRRAFANLVRGSSPQGQPRELSDVERQIAESMQPQSFLFQNLTATLETSVDSREVWAKNVIGVLPGRGVLADETVVLGAHYDHVGMGGAGSLAPGTIAVHNGADDNGSGTALLLEAARRLSRSRAESSEVPATSEGRPSSEGSEPLRRIVFIAFTAEEKGLLGSKHYVREPRFSLEETVAMVNLDMVGRLNNEAGLTVFGTGTAPEFDALVDRLNAKAGLPLHKDPSGMGPSDHSSFYGKQIPVLFFFTGLHPDYHRPSDDFEKINLDGMVRITDMVTQAVRHLASAAERPRYQTTLPGQAIHRKRGAYLGVELAAAGGEVVLAEVLAQSPAAQAGLRAEDRIALIDGDAVDSIPAVQRAIGGKKPGDVVQIVVLRNGQEVPIIATLGKRP